MIALLSIAGQPHGFWRGLTGAGGVTIRRADVLGVPCAHIALAPAQNIGAMNRRLKAAAGMLRRADVGTVCFAHDFPHAEYFRSGGFQEAGDTELFEAMHEQAAERLARAGSATYFYAPRVSGAAMQTLTVLCRTCRLVMADIPSGNARYLTALRREFGVSVVENPPVNMLTTAETAFFLGVPRFKLSLPDSCVVYAATPDALRAVDAARYVSALDVALPEDMERLLPEGFPRAPLIAGAMRGTALSRRALELRGVTISARGQAVFPA